MPPKADFSILPMSSDTVHGVALLAAECFSTPWSESIYQRELENPMGFTLVCLAGESVIGFVNCSFVLDELTLNTLAVSPHFRRQGIARQLWDAAMDKVKDRCAVCFLEVRESNFPARALYESMGFAQNGFRPHYYQAPDEAAVLMAKPLFYRKKGNPQH